MPTVTLDAADWRNVIGTLRLVAELPEMTADRRVLADVYRVTAEIERQVTQG